MKTSLNLPRSDFSWRLGTPATQYENPWMRADKTPAVHRELREETGFCANRLLKISLDAALEAVDAGEIRQALSVAAILKLGRMQAVGHLHGR